MDVARAVAVVGMFAVNVGPTGDTSLAGRLYGVAHGRASLLFVLVAGVGVSLLARTRSVSVPGARVALLWRAALLLPAGLALQLLDHEVNVILHGYAALFVIAVLMMTVGDRWLLAAAGAVAVLGPLTFLVGRMQEPARFTRSEVVWGDSASAVVDGLVLSGPYPVVTWAAPLLLGLWIGRRDLRDPQLQRWLLVAGGMVTVASFAVSSVGGLLVGTAEGMGWRDLLSTAPHSQMPLWLVGGTASAAFVLGGVLWLGEHARRSVEPLVALGQVALTAYVAHLVALHLWSDVLRSDAVARSAVVTVVGAGVLSTLALLWRQVSRHGPLEAVVRPPPVLQSAVARHRQRNGSP